MGCVAAPTFRSFASDLQTGASQAFISGFSRQPSGRGSAKMDRKRHR
jgi:hypothetical protein